MHTPTSPFIIAATGLARRRWPAALFLIWLVLLLLFFAKMAFSNLILARGDTFLYFYPYWEAAATALQHGRIPLWNPYLFMGAPFLANSQVGFFYPLNWPLWLLFSVPTAVKVTILLHLFLAGWGAYLAGRRALSLEPMAALITAVLFALGGYLTAQVEHINQLQGLAWLPWYLVVLAPTAHDSPRSRLVIVSQTGVSLAALLALQFLAGHTQSLFITVVGVMVWVLAQGAATWFTRQREYAAPFRFYNQTWPAHLPLASLLASLLAGGLAALLVAVQLLPTLELTQLSARQGGLSPNEVLSFSLNPLLLTRALFPGYGQSLFSEYTAFLPWTAVFLAVCAAGQWRRWRGVFPALVWVLLGLALALGIFNPLNWLLARLPGFDLFRVPARWLALYSLGMALLAGLGWQIALDRWRQQTDPWPELPEQTRTHVWPGERPLRHRCSTVALFLAVGLLGWGVLANGLALFWPTGPEAPYAAPSPLTMLLWLAEIFLAYTWLSGRRSGRHWRSPAGLAGMMILLLFWASRTQPYHNLTTPEAYFDLRPSVTRLLALAQTTDGRFLSLSHLFFDPGDQAEIDTIYADQLSAAARYDYTIAIKEKEIIAPNLSLTYGLAAVDGFDGGILPLRSYSQVAALLSPDGVETRDGRLRELLTAVPAAHWLDLFHIRYLITDKTGDEWRDLGIGTDTAFFDRQHPAMIAPGAVLPIGYAPPFTATALYVLAEGAGGQLQVTTSTGEVWSLTGTAVSEGLLSEGLLRFGWPISATAQSLTLVAPATAAWHVLAATLVNEVEGTFRTVVPGQYRLMHSGDVKIYENLDVLPRAFVLPAWQWQPDVAASVAAMRDAAFDPRQTAVLLGTGEAVTASPVGQATAVILADAPEQVMVRVTGDAPGLLLLTDAWYPGWHAFVDGQAVPLYQADGLFRGVFVPQGSHEVQFRFVSRSYEWGWRLSLCGLGVWLLLAVGAFYGGRRGGGG